MFVELPFTHFLRPRLFSVPSIFDSYKVVLRTPLNQFKTELCFVVAYGFREAIAEAMKKALAYAILGYAIEEK